MKTEISTLQWNVQNTHDPASVRRELKGMIGNHHPTVIALFEAYRLVGKLDGLGYQVVHYRPRGNKERSDTALMVRNGVRYAGASALVMRLGWRGPKVGAHHPPRWYRWLKIKVDGTVFKIGGFHLPFGKGPKTESVNAINGWFKSTIKGRPTIALGDMNIVAKVFRRRITTAKVVGSGIDLAAYKNCVCVRSQELGRHGSDHQAILRHWRSL